MISSAPSGAELFVKCFNATGKIKCWECGLEASKFILRHHPNDMNKPPVLELYADRGTTLVMMTRDHIIPASLGGVNDVENLRPGCSPCNSRRGHSMSSVDLQFMKANPQLVNNGNIKNAKTSYNKKN
jgi:hypothetical protein